MNITDAVNDGGLMMSLVIILPNIPFIVIGDHFIIQEWRIPILTNQDEIKNERGIWKMLTSPAKIGHTSRISYIEVVI